MICKFLLCSAFMLLSLGNCKNHRGISYVNNHLYTSGSQVVKTHGKNGEHDYQTPPKYSYEYGVSDHLSGDNKRQHEERDGDKVRGYYSFHDADGTIRTVRYTVDKDSGFNAVVERTGHADNQGKY